MRSMRIVKERSDLCYLVSAAIKTTYNTQSPGGVERCIDALNQLKYLSLSVKDIRLSKSIFKLEILRTHRNPKIRKEAQDLFHSWMKTLYARGDKSLKAALNKISLKPKKHVLTRYSELKKKEEQRSLQICEREEMKKETRTGFVESRKKEEQRSLSREGEEIKKKTYFLELKKKEYVKTCEEKDLKKDTKTDLKPLSLKRRGDTCEAVTTKKPRQGEVKVSGKQATTLTQHSRQNIKDKDGQVTTKTLIPPPRRSVYRSKQQQTGPAKDSANPKSAIAKTKTEEELKKKKTELVEVFEEAKKAANVANTKGILLGRAEASRCVDALSLLMRINLTPKPKEPRRMMERLEGLTKHKDRKICNAASALLQLWRQRTREQERRDSATKMFHNNPLEAY
ncbi:unnamed protein product [Arabis nemorensis]|uniref:TFIIS N-terminal domain-containing protein n=1 Tax=Arabis nemorensis TaxID=586526 RepID=A0A565C135_9BRAS|nr:unnamed protein product [Arabis nemorensis]